VTKALQSYPGACKDIFRINPKWRKSSNQIQQIAVDNPKIGNYRDKSRINWANTNHYFSPGPIRAQSLVGKVIADARTNTNSNTVRRIIEVSRSQNHDL
jgi:hypothetical protein